MVRKDTRVRRSRNSKSKSQLASLPSDMSVTKAQAQAQAQTHNTRSKSRKAATPQMQTLSNSESESESDSAAARSNSKNAYTSQPRRSSRILRHNTKSKSQSMNNSNSTKSVSDYNFEAQIIDEHKDVESSENDNDNENESESEPVSEYSRPRRSCRGVTRSQTQATTNSNSNGRGQKRKMTNADKNKGTPPSKKQAVSRQRGRANGNATDSDDSPSKLLGKALSNIGLAPPKSPDLNECLQNMTLDSAPKSRPKRKARLKLTLKYKGKSKAKSKSKSRAKSKRKTRSRAKVESESESESESEEVKDNWNRASVSRRSSDILHVQQQLLTHELAGQQLKGREVEYRAILDFVTQNLRRRQSNSLYLCGSPGTGKTATMFQVEQFLARTSNQRALNIDGNALIKLNAMRLSKPQDIYSMLYQRISGSHASINARDAIDALNSLLIQKEKAGSSSRRMLVVVVDECDGLLATQQTILYQLFLWCKKKHSRLLLIGIANSIDLTDRFLPRLRARNCEPQLLIFKPYSKTQLVDILKHRLRFSCRSLKGKNNAGAGADDNEDELPYFEEEALELCAQKVAKMYGDLRKCLEICRSSLSILIDDASKDKIGFCDMRCVLRDSFSSPLVDVIRELPNHQKILVAIASLLCEECAWITDASLEQFYKHVVAKFALPRCSSSEYAIMKDSLVADGILKSSTAAAAASGGNSGMSAAARSGKGKGQTKAKGRARGVKLQMIVPQCDVQFAVEDHKVLTSLFESGFKIPAKYLT